MEFQPATWREEREIRTIGEFSMRRINTEEAIGLFYRKERRDSCLAHYQKLTQLVRVNKVVIAVTGLHETTKHYVIRCEPVAFLDEQMGIIVDGKANIDEFSTIAEELLHFLRDIHNNGQAGITLDISRICLKDNDTPSLRVFDLSTLQSTNKQEIKQEDVRQLGRFLRDFSLHTTAESESDLRSLGERQFGHAGQHWGKLLSDMLKPKPKSSTLLFEDFMNKQKSMLSSAGRRSLHVSLGYEEIKAEPAYPKTDSPPKRGMASGKEALSYNFSEHVNPFPIYQPSPSDTPQLFRLALEWVRHGQNVFARRYIIALLESAATTGAPLKVRVQAEQLSCRLCRKQTARESLFRLICLHYVCKECLSVVASSDEVKKCECGVVIELQEKEKGRLTEEMGSGYQEYEWRLT